MAVKSSGTLSFNTDIVGEFSGDTPHSLSEYYRNGSYVTSNNTDVPTSGEISFSDFYGGSAIVDASDVISPVTINGVSTAKQITISDYISSGGIFTIPSSWWIWSDSTSTPALLIDIPCTITNNGKIIGKGGIGGDGSQAQGSPTANNGSNRGNNGAAGGPAIKITSTGVTLTNASGAYIAGGGGGGAMGGNDGWNYGGGGGAGGGPGGASGSNGSRAGGAGGAVNASGSDGDSYSVTDSHGDTRAIAGGGGGGAGGGRGSRYDTTPRGESGGGGGGRILPGTGGTGGNSGGNGGSAGNSATYGGGGGWGASGGNSHNGSTTTYGGSGGKAIEDSGNSYSLTNNGTIYGATT